MAAGNSMYYCIFNILNVASDVKQNSIWYEVILSKSSTRQIQDRSRNLHKYN